jgi:hypothetical protein
MRSLAESSQFAQALALAESSQFAQALALAESNQFAQAVALQPNLINMHRHQHKSATISRTQSSSSVFSCEYV